MEGAGLELVTGQVIDVHRHAVPWLGKVLHGGSVHSTAETLRDLEGAATSPLEEKREHAGHWARNELQMDRERARAYLRRRVRRAGYSLAV